MATRTTSSYTFEARATVFWSRIRAASTPSTPRAPFHSAVGRSGRFRPAMALFRRVLMASSAMFMQCPVIRILKIPSAQVCSALAVERLRVSLVAARTALSDMNRQRRAIWLSRWRKKPACWDAAKLASVATAPMGLACSAADSRCSRRIKRRPRRAGRRSDGCLRNRQRRCRRAGNFEDGAGGDPGIDKNGAALGCSIAHRGPDIASEINRRGTFGDGLARPGAKRRGDHQPLVLQDRRRPDTGELGEAGLGRGG